MSSVSLSADWHYTQQTANQPDILVAEPADQLFKALTAGRLGQPLPADLRHLAVFAAHEYRVRVGDWRVVYTLYHDMLMVLAVRIADRREAHR